MFSSSLALEAQPARRLVAKSRCRWIVCFDADEYVHPRSPPSLVAIVRQHDSQGDCAIRMQTMLMTALNLRECPTSGVEGYPGEPGLPVESRQAIVPISIAWSGAPK